MAILEYAQKYLREYYYLLPLLPPLLWVLYYRFISPMSRIPGPFSASLSRLWLIRQSMRGDMHQMYVDLHRKYGPVVRTGPTEVSIADLPAIKTIYSAGTQFNKTGWYDAWGAGQEASLFSERDEKVHARLQRLISGVYSMTSMGDFEPYMDRSISIFMQLMRDRAGQSVDLGKWLQLLAFDVIGEITFSKSFEFMQDGKDDGSFKNIWDALWLGSWIGQIPWLFWTIFNIKSLFTKNMGVSGDMGKVLGLAIEEMNERKKRGQTDRPDMLGKGFNLQKEKPTEITDGILMVIAISNIMAGSDTTAITMRAVFYYLLKNPQCMARLREEIEDARKRDALSNPVTYEQARQLPYLQACISEALRIHPAVGMTLPREVPAGGMHIGKYYLPAGSTVGASAWVIHRDESIFGPEVDSFRPERWLKADTKEMGALCLSWNLDSIVYPW